MSVSRLVQVRFQASQPERPYVGPLVFNKPMHTPLIASNSLPAVVPQPA